MDPKLNLLTGWLGANSISITDDQISGLYNYMTEILRINEYINLTAIKDPTEFEIKHILDSLSVLPFLKEAAGLPGSTAGFSLIDIGTGGGFPLGPLAAYHWFGDFNGDFAGLDSTRKKIRAVGEALDLCGIKDVDLFHARAEDLAHDPDHREKYDFVTSRAVGSLLLLMELSAGFLNTGGSLIAYKSVDIEDELSKAKTAAVRFGLRFDRIIEYELPQEMGSRQLVIYRKEAPTPAKYPRSSAVIRKSR